MSFKNSKKPPWFSVHKPKRPTKEEIKEHKKQIEKLLPLMKEVFPDMEIGKDFNEKKEKI